jgi:hypothetical protein
MLKINAMDVNASATFCDEISSKATEATGECVPTNSSSRYEKEYEQFCEWKKKHIKYRKCKKRLWCKTFLFRQ